VPLWRTANVAGLSVVFVTTTGWRKALVIDARALGERVYDAPSEYGSEVCTHRQDAPTTL
jgi:hypothetical protein